MEALNQIRNANRPTRFCCCRSVGCAREWCVQSPGPFEYQPHFRAMGTFLLGEMAVSALCLLDGWINPWKVLLSVMKIVTVCEEMYAHALHAHGVSHSAVPECSCNSQVSRPHATGEAAHCGPFIVSASLVFDLLTGLSDQPAIRQMRVYFLFPLLSKSPSISTGQNGWNHVIRLAR